MVLLGQFIHLPASFAAARTPFESMPRLLTTRGFPPTRARNREFSLGFSPSLRSIRAVRDGSDTIYSNVPRNKGMPVSKSTMP